MNLYDINGNTINSNSTVVGENNQCDGYIRLFHNICFIGDSLTEGDQGYTDSSGVKHETVCQNYSWPYYLCNKYDINYKKYSKNGMQANTWIEKFGANFQSDTSTYGAFYIFLGTNERAQNFQPIGNAEDSVDTISYCGCLKKIIEMCHGNNPHAPVFINSAYIYGSSWKPDLTLTNLGKSICDLYDYCFYIDFTSNEDSQAIKNMWNGHFTTVGYVMVANDVEKETDRIISENKDYFKAYGFNNKDI